MPSIFVFLLSINISYLSCSLAPSHLIHKRTLGGTAGAEAVDKSRHVRFSKTMLTQDPYCIHNVEVDELPNLKKAYDEVTRSKEPNHFQREGLSNSVNTLRSNLTPPSKRRAPRPAAAPSAETLHYGKEKSSPSNPLNHKLKSMLARIRKSIGNKASRLFSNISVFFQRPRSGRHSRKAPATRPFDHPVKKTGLHHHLLTRENLDPEVDKFIDGISSVKNNSPKNIAQGKRQNSINISNNLKKNFQEPVAMHGESYIKEQVHKVFEEFHKALEYEERIIENLKSHSEAIAKQTSNILLGTDVSDDGAIRRLAKKISAYRSKILLKDQKAIQSFLPVEQKYLSRLLGFFGPNNIFFPYIDEIFETRYYTGAMDSDLYDERKFLQEIEGVQGELSKLVHFNQEVQLLSRGKTHLQEFYPDPAIKASILVWESKLITLFGGRDQFISLLNDIESWDLYRGFMHELKNPKSETGYLLQLLEPWGYFRQYLKIHQEDQPYIGFYKSMNHHSVNASKIIRNHMYISARFRKVEHDLEKIFQPDGLKAFIISLNKGQQNITSRKERLRHWLLGMWNK
ncbi:hypothetical protein PSTT_02636, partial [Puccinia striiformis]